MTSLLILALILLATWIWGIWERDRRAQFMHDWMHVPFVAGITCLVMALGLWIR